MTYSVNLTKGLKIGRNGVDLVQNKTDDVHNLDPQVCNYLKYISPDGFNYSEYSKMLGVF